jgi:flagellar assembly factor FliW
MKIHSKRFGTELEFDDQLLINMPAGLPGFPASKRFCILELGEADSPFKWLHDVDNTAIALLVTDPFLFFPTYRPKIPQRVVEELAVDNIEENLGIFSIVKITAGGKEAFTNLRAPVIVNMATRVAVQVILEDDQYSVKTALFFEQKQAASAAG